MIVDTHCHLNDRRYSDNVEIYLKRAKEKGVSTVIVIGIDVKSSQKAIEMAEKYDEIYAVVGIHPNHLFEMQQGDEKKIEKMLSHPKVVALGEIGLDYHWNKSPREKQKSYFEAFIKMAFKNNKPIVIHNRAADYDTLQTLTKNKEFLTKGVMHCYSGSKEMVKDFVNLGMYISFAGPLTFLNAKAPKEAAKAVPFDRLLIETDAPYLTPHPLRGKQNEPAYVRYVAEEMARLLNMSFEEVAAMTTENARLLFGIK